MFLNPSTFSFQKVELWRFDSLLCIQYALKIVNEMKISSIQDKD